MSTNNNKKIGWRALGPVTALLSKCGISDKYAGMIAEALLAAAAVVITSLGLVGCSMSEDKWTRMYDIYQVISESDLLDDYEPAQINEGK